MNIHRQHLHAIELAATTVKKWMEVRGYTPDIFDGCIYGQTIPQPSWFYSNPWFCALIGNDKISGPTISQACATSATCIYTAAAGIETGMYQNVLVATTDRCSNGQHAIGPNQLGPGGQVGGRDEHVLI